MAQRKKVVEEIVDTSSPDASSLVEVAVLKNDIKHINETLGRLETKWDAAVQSFASVVQLQSLKDEFDRKCREYDKTIEDLQKDVRTLREKDAEQQGAIDASQRNFTRMTTVALIVVGLMSAIWWVPALIATIQGK